ncbi:hypothetical protein C8R47DRAFT_1270426 [Mycena vitilis]|nr:hypothetical protein C8R47DRAFT_1270426 [Mycena vitilis]
MVRRRNLPVVNKTVPRLLHAPLDINLSKSIVDRAANNFPSAVDAYGAGSVFLLGFRALIPIATQAISPAVPTILSPGDRIGSKPRKSRARPGTPTFSSWNNPRTMIAWRLQVETPRTVDVSIRRRLARCSTKDTEVMISEGRTDEQGKCRLAPASRNPSLWAEAMHKRCRKKMDVRFPRRGFHVVRLLAVVDGKAPVIQRVVMRGNLNFAGFRGYVRERVILYQEQKAGTTSENLIQINTDSSFYHFEPWRRVQVLDWYTDCLPWPLDIRISEWSDENIRGQKKLSE